MPIALTAGMFTPHPIVGRILACATAVHQAFGPGLLESVYDACLESELRRSGLRFRHQVPLLVNYHEREIGLAYRLDFVVEDEVLVEIKAVEKLLPLHFAQVRTYLKVSGLPRGLLLNFNDRLMKAGTYSFLNRQPESVNSQPDQIRQAP
ncbi:MAG: GxxExxY protein [Vicinamibacterales bacterium]